MNQLLTCKFSDCLSPCLPFYKQLWFCVQDWGCEVFSEFQPKIRLATFWLLFGFRSRVAKPRFLAFGHFQDLALSNSVAYWKMYTNLKHTFLEIHKALLALVVNSIIRHQLLSSQYTQCFKGMFHFFHFRAQKSNCYFSINKGQKWKGSNSFVVFKFKIYTV